MTSAWATRFSWGVAAVVAVLGAIFAPLPDEILERAYGEVLFARIAVGLVILWLMSIAVAVIVHGVLGGLAPTELSLTGVKFPSPADVAALERLEEVDRRFQRRLRESAVLLRDAVARVTTLEGRIDDLERRAAVLEAHGGRVGGSER